MTDKAIFYHAECAVCADAEQRFAQALDKSRYDVEIVHLGEEWNRIDEAERAGVKSVPAFVIADAVCHINHGADLSALR